VRSVQLQVSLQVALLSESRVAVLADKGLLSSVQPQVLRQTALVARAIMAMRTCKRHLRPLSATAGVSSGCSSE
jgi:hypothetical protein